MKHILIGIGSSFEQIREAYEEAIEEATATGKAVLNFNPGAYKISSSGLYVVTSIAGGSITFTFSGELLAMQFDGAITTFEVPPEEVTSFPGYARGYGLPLYRRR